MKKYAVVLTFLILFPSLLVAEDGYILFDVKVEGHRNDDPVWLAVVEGVDLSHWRIERHIFKVPPGEYRVDHIDFHERIKFGHGTLGVSRKGRVKFDVRPGHINYLGTLNVQKNNRGNFELKFSADSALIDLACIINPDVFSEMKVVVALLPDSQEVHQVKCAGLKNE